MSESKIAQFKRTNTLSLTERTEFIRLPNDEISDETPRFASVQSKYIA